MARGLEELLQDKNVQALIAAMMYLPAAKLLKPIITAAGRVSYPTLGIVGFPQEQSLSALDDLVESHLLSKRVSKELLGCPHCNSLNIGISATCPSCKKPTIQINDILEHSCGYTATFDKFVLVSKDLLKCPKCGKETKREETTRKGRYYKCDDCKETLETFRRVITCNNCEKEFEMDSGMFAYLYEYSLNEEYSSKTINAIVRFSAVGEMLTQEGFEVQMPGQILGVSGITYVSNIVARKKLKDEKQIVLTIDGIITDTTVDAGRIMEIGSKILDSKPDSAFFLAIPKLEEKAANLSKQLGIITIEAKDVNEASERIKELLVEKGLIT